MKVLKEIAGSELQTPTEVLFWAKHCTSLFCFLLQTALWNVISNDKKTETQMISDEKLPKVPGLRQRMTAQWLGCKAPTLCALWLPKGERGGESRRWADLTVFGETCLQKDCIKKLPPPTSLLFLAVCHFLVVIYFHFSFVFTYSLSLSFFLLLPSFDCFVSRKVTFSIYFLPNLAYLKTTLYAICPHVYRYTILGLLFIIKTLKKTLLKNLLQSNGLCAMSEG